MAKISDNLRRLHIEEERIRSCSLAQIEAEPATAFHVEALETAMNTLIHFALRWSSDDRDVITVQELGVRLCSSAAASFKLVLAGYYHSAIAQSRDLFETGLLLDYLSTDASLIAMWREADGRKAREQFEPRNVRAVLDKRDGFQQGQRATRYRAMSTYGTHPHPKATLLLRATGSSLTQPAPFYDSKLLVSVLDEVGTNSLYAAEQLLSHFKSRNADDDATRSGFDSMAARWNARLQSSAS
jgi:hypothetical protein